MNSVKRAVGKFDYGYLIVLLLSLPSAIFLAQRGYPSTHDGLHDLFRLLDLDWRMHGGALYPRWLPSLGFGYGYTVLMYYAPLAYYLAEFFHCLWAGYVLSLEWAYAVGFFLSGLAMYLYAREIQGRWAAITASLAYVYFPITWLMPILGGPHCYGRGLQSGHSPHRW